MIGNFLSVAKVKAKFTKMVGELESIIDNQEVIRDAAQLKLDAAVTEIAEAKVFKNNLKVMLNGNIAEV